MNARKAVLADNPELILQVLRLRFDEALSYPVISAQTGVSKTAIFLRCTGNSGHCHLFFF
ncbi:hypothetical protein DOH76_25320 [Salmonella enterica subsp. enterica serovar Oranienburg]|nr:hypothetical protein [Salmonella enterica]EBI7017915.1 hypothetical protein [Salmonella enterica]EBV3242794.1 hypothetical protein [Salmonella enterica subsp. enterica serovar Oranienburg]ECD0388807.1 hypothetical protein [Salmonella enterica subsp. enterica serovar Oranienburg]EGX3624861.1 hypothetical protein [Salmonella enterica]